MAETNRLGRPKPPRRSGKAHARGAATNLDSTPDDDDRRLDAELADTFPTSDPPSILRRGPEAKR
jgi:hypothetical protein